MKRLKGGEMGHITFEFNHAKAVEAILYLANKLPHPGIYVICKLLYLADKYSLEKYGRFIFGESYFAMEEGATPSKAYDLLKAATVMSVDGIQVQNKRVIALRPPNLDELSDSDIECLEQIIDIPHDRMIRDSHDEAYQKSWDRRGNKKSIIIPVENIAKLFPDSEDLLDYLVNRNE